MLGLGSFLEGCKIRVVVEVLVYFLSIFVFFVFSFMGGGFFGRISLSG